MLTFHSPHILFLSAYMSASLRLFVWVYTSFILPNYCALVWERGRWIDLFYFSSLVPPPTASCSQSFTQQAGINTRYDRRPVLEHVQECLALELWFDSCHDNKEDPSWSWVGDRELDVAAGRVRHWTFFFIDVEQVIHGMARPFFMLATDFFLYLRRSRPFSKVAWRSVFPEYRARRDSWWPTREAPVLRTHSLVMFSGMM